MVADGGVGVSGEFHQRQTFPEVSPKRLGTEHIQFLGAGIWGLWNVTNFLAKASLW